MTNLVTLEEVRTALRAAGKTQAQLAREVSAELGVSEAIVHQVLSGKLSGTKGDARRVKVRLGMVNDTMTALDVVDEVAKRRRG